MRDRGSEGCELGVGFWNSVLLTAFERPNEKLALSKGAVEQRG